MLATASLLIALTAHLASLVQAWTPGDKHPQGPIYGTPTYANRTLAVSIWLPLPPSEGTTPTGVATTSSITYQFTKPKDFISGSSYIAYPGVAKVGCSKLVSTKLAKKAPLIILSHGHPGKKELWSGHAEALASKGYAVVAIDHTDALLTTTPYAANLSTASFVSSLLNRRQDQLFIYDQIAALTTTVPASTSKLAYLYNNVDATKSTIMGYSFGGYGALLTAGATLNPSYITAIGLGSLAPFFTPLQTASTRPGIKASVAISPWGNGSGFLGTSFAINMTSLANIKIPQLIIAGDLDDVAGYAGIVQMFQGLTSSTGKMMVTIKNASHNIALNPPPSDWLAYSDSSTWQRLAEENWDQGFLNNIVQHFASAYIQQVIVNGTSTSSTNSFFTVTPGSGPDANGVTTPRSIAGFQFRTSDGVYINFA
ncbi:hypothetical protein HDU76_006547 [Blyttiomyces sp. JEL0837]|nr:hypothetical protein HDU76_006547 [Blyttiomyces sp. JEL0837]